MAWIESHQTVWDHPKTRKAAAKLGIEPVQLVGHLHSLWHWGLDMAEDGDLSKYDADDIAIAARWTGDPKQFVDVLAECGSGGSHGFIERTDYGMRLRNWDRYTDRLVARRESSRKANHDRWHAERGVRSDSCEWCAESDPPSDPPPPDPPPNPDASDPESDRNPSGVPSDDQRSPGPSDSESTNPTRPDQHDQPEPNQERESARRKRRSTPMPDDWQPTSGHQEKAAKLGVDTQAEAEAFRDHHLAKDSRFVDWDRAFHTWLNNTQKFGANGGRKNGQSGRAPPPSHRVSEFTESGMVQP